MPKMKTRKAVAKRFKVTGTGKVVHSQAGNSHLMTHKSSGQSRQLRQEKTLTKADRKRVKKMLPGI